MSWFGKDEGSEKMTNGYLPNLEPTAPQNLGNSNMVNVPSDNSAMDLMNNPQTKEAFGLGSAPIPPPRRGLGKAVPKFNRTVGDIEWKTGETWGVLIGGVALGMITLTVWNRFTK